MGERRVLLAPAVRHFIRFDTASPETVIRHEPSTACSDATVSPGFGIEAIT